MGIARITAFEAASTAAELARTAQSHPKPTPFSADAGLTVLTRHIEQTHHARLRTMLPLITSLADQVAQEQNAPSATILMLRERFQEFQHTMEAHLDREERHLFPLCRSLESEFPCHAAGAVIGPIEALKPEHDRATDLLCEIRLLAGAYKASSGASPAWRTMLAALAALELDTHVHVHKENCILFPKVQILAAVLRAGGCGE